MSLLQIKRDKNRIDNLFKKYPDLGGKYDLVSHWSNYICVLICGYIEQSVKAILCEYSENKSHPNVSRYVELRLNRMQNPKSSVIIELLSHFNYAWSQDFNRYLLDKDIISGVDSIVNTRQLIAHGINTTITAGDLRKYYKDVNKMLGCLYRIVNS